MSLAETAVGASVRLVVRETDAVVSGELFAYDAQADVAVVKCASSKLPVAGSQPVTMVLVKGPSVKAFEVTAPAPATVDLTLPHASIERVMAKRERALKKAAEAAARIGTNVSTAAQDTFDYLYRMFSHDCRWSGENIMVMGEVIVAPPYTLESVRSTRPESAEFVRKYLEKRPPQ